jgi:hypothetical protein
MTSSQDIIRAIKSRSMRWMGHVTYGRNENCIMYYVFFWKSEGKRLLGVPDHRWEGNVKIYVKSVGHGDVG